MGDQVDFILFPELVTSGYACGGLFETDDFVGDCVDANDLIFAATRGKKATVIFGCPLWATGDDREPNGNLRITNSALVIENGQVLGRYDKRLLANDYQHEDRKYFLPGDKALVLRKGDLTYGVLICEDIWGRDHGRDLVAEMKEQYPSLGAVFIPNFSYFTTEKERHRHQLLCETARKNSVALYYTNAVGIGDVVKNIIIYDGRSLAFNPYGELIDNLAAFAPDPFNITYSDARSPRWYDAYDNQDKAYEKNRVLWEALLFVQREMFAQVGIQRAQVHMSGGLDSAIVGVLVAKAMGAANTVFINNPSRANGELTKGNAKHTADKLGVELLVMPVQAVSEEIARAIRSAERRQKTGSAVEIPDFMAEYYGQKSQEPVDYLNPLALATAQAVGRTALGLTYANQAKTSVVCTGNHTENVLGWFTFHDIGSSGLYQPIGDLTKTELFSLAAWVNRYYGEELIPNNLFDGSTKPMAELADAKDDPFDYPLYSGICAEMIRRRLTAADLIQGFYAGTLNAEAWGDKLNIFDYDPDIFEAACIDAEKRAKRSVFKCAQAAPVVILATRSRGFSSRETILNHYKGYKAE
jgi:NAD+ synthase (glutamine-hydrolysing)